MASITFPKAQNATFVSPAGTSKFHSVNLHTNPFVANITGSGDADVNLMNGLTRYDVSGIASVANTGFAKSQSSQITLGTMLLKPHDWTVGKRWNLVDVTGSGDTEKNWQWGWPVIYGSIRAWAITNGPVYQTQVMSMSAAFDLFGTVAGSVNIRSMLVGAPIRTGGPIPVSLQFQATGQITHTSSMVPIMDTDGTVDPYKGSLTLALDTGETVSHAALLYQYSVRCTAMTGGPLVLNCQFRFDQASS